LSIPRGVEPAGHDVAPQFERTSGDKVDVSYGSAAALAKRIEDGERSAAAILSPTQLQHLAQRGKVVPQTVRPIAKVGMGARRRQFNGQHLELRARIDLAMNGSLVPRRSLLCSRPKRLALSPLDELQLGILTTF
jgi:hypothetical protein